MNLTKEQNELIKRREREWGITLTNDQIKTILKIKDPVIIHPVIEQSVNTFDLSEIILIKEERSRRYPGEIWRHYRILNSSPTNISTSLRRMIEISTEDENENSRIQIIPIHPDIHTTRCELTTIDEVYEFCVNHLASVIESNMEIDTDDVIWKVLVIHNPSGSGLRNHRALSIIDEVHKTSIF